MAGITSTLGQERGPDDPLYIGSIKPNVGHTEGCSGLAGVFKAIHCLEQGILVPTAGFKTLNPKLTLSEWGLAMPLENMEWPRPGVRRISVNSFGFGGANGHVILDDAYHYLKQRGLTGKHSTVTDFDENDSGIGTPPPAPENRNRLFVFTAKDQAAVQRVASVYANALEPLDLDGSSCKTRSLGYFDNLAFTLATRRTQHDFRSFAIANSVESLCTELSKTLPKLGRSSKKNNIVFVFTGQGAQWPAMGVELLRTPVFRISIQQTQEHLSNLGCSWNVVEELRRTTDSKVDQPEYSQTLCTAIQIALVDMLSHWGIKPKATVGHSSGEIGAAYAAGAISHRDALKIAYFRGICSSQVSSLLDRGRKGGMLAAGLSEAEAQPYLDQIEAGSALVACVNSPSSITISGDLDAITKLEDLISKDGKFARKLRVQTAYHSPHMQLVAQRYEELMGIIDAKETSNTGVKMFSSVTGDLIDTSKLGASYWVQNMCEQVKFSQALTSILDHSVTVAGRGNRKIPVNWSAVLEIGPHGALQGPTGQILKASTAKVAATLQYACVLARGQDAEVTTLKAAGQLWSLGHDLAFLDINHHGEDTSALQNLTDLPAYPWNHSKGFWHEAVSTRSIRFPPASRNDFLGIPAENQNHIEPRWRNRLRISENPWIEHHSITGTILYPAAGMLIMVIEAAQQIADRNKTLKGVAFHNVNFERGLVIPSGDQAAETSLSVKSLEGSANGYSFAVFSIPVGGNWIKHCYGKFSIIYEDTTSDVESSSIDSADWKDNASAFEEIRSQSRFVVDIPKLYQDLVVAGMEYGESFRNMTHASAVAGKHRCWGKVKIPDTKSLMPFEFEYPHKIHPATLDAIFHLLFVAFADGESMAEAAVPYTLEHMYVAADLPQGAGKEYVGYAQCTKQNGRETAGDIIISDASWAEPKITIRNFVMRQVTSGNREAAGASGQQDAFSPQRCVGIEWAEDVDFLQGAQAEKLLQRHEHENTSKHPELQSWLRKLCHKTANIRALLLVEDCGEASAIASEISNEFGPLEGKARRFGKCTVAKISELANVDLEPDTLDLVITLSGSRHFSVDQISDIISRSQQATKEGAHTVFSFHTGGRGTVKNTSDHELTLSSAGLQVLISLESITRQRLIISRASTNSNQITRTDDVYLLDDPNSSANVAKFKQGLSTILSENGIRVHTVSLADIERLRGQHVISLLELEKPFVKGWKSTAFEQFKNLISAAKHMLWITKGGQTLNPQNVDFAPTTGLLRVIRSEYPQITLPHLDLSHDARLDVSTARLLAKVWLSTVSLEESEPEMEFAEMNSDIFIPRVVEEPGFDRELELHSGRAAAIIGKLSDSKALTLKVEGVFIEDTETDKDIDEDEVEIRVEAVSLNDSEIEGSNSAAMHSELVTEAVGIVTKLGSKVRRFNVGQRVVTVKKECLRTHIRQHQSWVVAVPSRMPATTCVVLPRAFCTAWYALNEIARLSKGDSVLIHNAASGLGQAVIGISQCIGADIFATVANQEQKNLLISHYNIPEDHIFDSHLANFARGVLRQTSGRGVNVIINTKGGQVLAESCSCLAEFGHLVDLSKSSNGAQLVSAPFKPNTFFAALDIDQIIQSRPEAIQKTFHKILEMAEARVIGNIPPVLTYSITEWQEATEVAQTNQHAGKIAITFDKNADVLVLPPSPPQLELDPAGTYILAGGLGALGFDIAQMMFDHGARHIVFLSRSGGSKCEDKLQEFRDAGFQVDALKCDISSDRDVKAAVNQLNRNGNRIKGLLQCAMVLEDGIFQTMPLEVWEHATRPKIDGTWNLHQSLPKDLDFFIMLSSVVSVIGNAGQANYIAGNTYEDAFAKYRRNQGLAATTINVGIVADSAHFIAENDISKYIEKYGYLASLLTAKEELKVAIRATIRGKTADGSLVPAQVVVSTLR